MVINLHNINSMQIENHFYNHGEKALMKMAQGSKYISASFFF